MKHTQGPWKVREYATVGKKWGICIYDDNTDVKSSMICHVRKTQSEEDDELKANAHLIAAAPKLLKALDHALTALCDATPSSKYTDIKKEGFVAINEAEGRE